MTNKEQFELLKESPRQLLLSPVCQNKIKSVVSILVAMHKIPKGLKNDVIQEINAIFLSEKMTAIQKQYSIEKGAFMSYFKRCVYNESLKIAHNLRGKEVAHIQKEPSDFLTPALSTNPEKILMQKEHLEMELARLEDYLKFFGSKRAKLEFLLKLYARIPLKRVDFHNYNTDISSDLADNLLVELEKPLNFKTDSEIYELVSPLFNAVEKKTATSDSLRKWLNEKVTEIMVALNHFGGEDYDKQSFKNLLTVFFNKSIKPEVHSSHG